MENKEREVRKHLCAAIKEVDNLMSGEEFLVKDLFLGYKWKRIAIGVRRDLGRFFYDQMKSVVDVCDKTSSNQQKYRKR